MENSLLISNSQSNLTTPLELSLKKSINPSSHRQYRNKLLQNLSTKALIQSEKKLTGLITSSFHLKTPFPQNRPPSRNRGKYKIPITTSYQLSVSNNTKKKTILLSDTIKFPKKKSHSGNRKKSKNKNKSVKHCKQLSLSQENINNNKLNKIHGNQKNTIKKDKNINKNKNINKLKSYKYVLPPIPIKNTYNKSTNSERSAVYIRRIEYSIQLFNEFNSKKEKKCEVCQKRSIIFIQEWWKTMYKVIKIQKTFRGHLLRKRIIKMLENEEILINKLICLDEVFRKVYLRMLFKKMKLYMKSISIIKVIQKQIRLKKGRTIIKWKQIVKKKKDIEVIIRFNELLFNKTKRIIFNRIKSYKRIEFIKPAKRIKIMRKKKPKRLFKYWRYITFLKKILSLLLIERKANINKSFYSLNESEIKNNTHIKEKNNTDIGINIYINNEMIDEERDRDIIIQKEEIKEENNSIDYINRFNVENNANSEECKNEYKDKTPLKSTNLNEREKLKENDNQIEVIIPIPFNTPLLNTSYSKEEEKPSEMLLETPMVFKEYSNDETYSEELTALNKAIENNIQQQYVKEYNKIEEVSIEDSSDDEATKQNNLILLSNEKNKQNNDNIYYDEFQLPNETIITQKIIYTQKKEDSYIDRHLHLIKNKNLYQSNLNKLISIISKIPNPNMVKGFKLWRSIIVKKVILRKVIIKKKRQSYLFKKLFTTWKKITMRIKQQKQQNKKVKHRELALYYDLLSPKEKAKYNEERNIQLEYIFTKQYIKKIFKKWKKKLEEHYHLNQLNQSTHQSEEFKYSNYYLSQDNIISSNEGALVNYKTLNPNIIREEENINSTEGNSAESIQSKKDNGSNICETDMNGKAQMGNNTKFYYKPKIKLHQLHHSQSICTIHPIENEGVNDERELKEVKSTKNKDKILLKQHLDIKEYCIVSLQKNPNVPNLDLTPFQGTNNIIYNTQLNKKNDEEKDDNLNKTIIIKEQEDKEINQVKDKTSLIFYSTVNKSKKRGKMPTFNIKKNCSSINGDDIYVYDISNNNNNEKQNKNNAIKSDVNINKTNNLNIDQFEEDKGNLINDVINNNNNKNIIHNIDIDNGLKARIESKKIIFKKQK